MNYEQKYKEALEKLQDVFAPREDGRKISGLTREYIENIFPELKETDDEKMLKLLKKYVHYNISDMALEADHITREELESWLEKQDKKDPCIGCINDKGCVTCENGNLKEIKIEPKFKVGDWIILPLGMIAHIDSINSTDYQVTTTDGKICDFKISKQDNYRLLTRKIDADKAIEWVRQNICTACYNEPDVTISQRIDKFKKDFGL